MAPSGCVDGRCAIDEKHTGIVTTDVRGGDFSSTPLPAVACRPGRQANSFEVSASDNASIAPGTFALANNEVIQPTSRFRTALAPPASACYRSGSHSTRRRSDARSNVIDLSREAEVGILDKAVNVGIILVCGAVVTDIALRNLRPQPAAASAPSAANRPALPNEYKPGEALDPLPGFASKSETKSLLFVVKSTCRFCTDSMPFYQRVVQEVRTAKSPLRLVGVCVESSEACTEYLKRHNLDMDLTLAVPQGTLKVVGTPTLILVDEAGKVGSIWTGFLPTPEQQQAVLDTVLTRKPGNS